MTVTIRAPDLKSGDPEFKSRSADHILFQVVFGSNALYLRSLSRLLFHRQLVCLQPVNLNCLTNSKRRTHFSTAFLGYHGFFLTSN